MTFTIHKYPLLELLCDVTMPLGALVLTAQMQHDRPCLWALVDLDEPAVERRWFVTVGTGHPMNYLPGRYVGTVQHDAIVRHIFEATPG